MDPFTLGLLQKRTLKKELASVCPPGKMLPPICPDEPDQKKMTGEIKKTIIQKLEQVRPYLQPNTQLGGQALMELATAYYYDSNLDDDENDSSISKSETIVQLILEKNLDRSTIRQAKQLLIQITNDTKSNTRPSKGIFGFNFDTFSW